jgi:hypothetical protein
MRVWPRRHGPIAPLGYRRRVEIEWSPTILINLLFWGAVFAILVRGLRRLR